MEGEVESMKRAFISNLLTGLRPPSDIIQECMTKLAPVAAEHFSCTLTGKDDAKAAREFLWKHKLSYFLDDIFAKQKTI